MSPSAPKTRVYFQIPCRQAEETMKAGIAFRLSYVQNNALTSARAEKSKTKDALRARV